MKPIIGENLLFWERDKLLTGKITNFYPKSMCSKGVAISSFRICTWRSEDEIFKTKKSAVEWKKEKLAKWLEKQMQSYNNRIEKLKEMI